MWHSAFTSHSPSCPKVEEEPVLRLLLCHSASNSHSPVWHSAFTSHSPSCPKVEEEPVLRLLLCHNASSSEARCSAACCKAMEECSWRCTDDNSADSSTTDSTPSRSLHME
eukprot:1149422-Pelagomonas_calceolata.AAC.7